MNNTIIKIENLYKNYNTNDNITEVLKGVSFEIKRGEFVSIMGMSGCGKSTFLYLIAGLDKIDDGTVYICDKNISNLKDSEISKLRRQNIGFVFQFYNLVANLTVEENILLPVIIDGKKIKDYKDSLNELLKLINLEDKRTSYPNELSGGQQQRVAIARAIIMNPEIILADEPTGNLDKQNGQFIMELFKRINKEKNITILQVTHSEEIAQYGSRILTLNNGIIDSDITL